MNFHRFIRPLLSCAALAAVAIVLAGGCGSSDSGGEPARAEAGAPPVDGSTTSDTGEAPDGSFDANACQPGDISDFKPAWKTPTGFHQGACASNGDETPLWVQFRMACLGASANKQDCMKFSDAKQPYYSKCGQCLATADTADHYGPLIVHTGWVELNVAGCLANAMNDPSGVKCASSVQAARGCELAACSANCPVTSDAALTLFDNCTKAADGTLCSTYEQAAATCLEQVPDAGDVGKCVEKQGFDAHFDDLAELFCGDGAPMDAGTGQD